MRNEITTRILGIALILVGALLFYYGYSEGTSAVGVMSEAFTGSPPERSMAKMLGGVVLAALGAGSLFYRTKAL